MALSVFLCAHGFAATWPVMVDGKAVNVPWFSLSETPEELAVGDVLIVAGAPVLVRDTDNLNFINKLSKKAKLHRVLPSGRKELVAFYPDYWDGKWRRPRLKKLSKREIKGLWGVSISEESGSKTGLIQGEDTFVDIKYTAWKKVPLVLPGLPFRAVKVDWNADPDAQLYSLFSESTRFVSLDVSARELQFKCESLLRSKDMKWLSLRLEADELDDPGIPAQFRKLRYLFWPWAGLRAVDFLSNLNDLKEIHIAGNAITDITPLAGLPRLSALNVQMSPLASLPDGGFPKLKNLVLFGTAVPADAVESFRKQHPDCVVQYDWAAELRNVISSADRFIVRTGGTCHRRYDKEKIIFETVSQDEIAGLISLITIDGKTSNGVCMCCGTPTMEFYKNGKLIAMVGIQHGRALRWGGWPADAVLTEESIKQFTEWLYARGVKEPSEEIERAKSQRAMIEEALKAQGKQ
ncbi:leucine-rich repeat domain-containing protein [Ereboglobus sp. PH5-10]|uniref:leucine-rich repeat domain-containing protein n=1 Tax=Ereboglobus sp. PH5-10 TaxID=2940629 RepID=UPI0024075B87|nr:leucine-rich repeat domain-containing protein [Ereboglobus sp. PH5-10]